MIVGREAELAELDRLLTDLRAGRGRPLVLAGEPGIGEDGAAGGADRALRR